MSSGQRIHHKSSPVSIKQGPLKATIPMISLYKHQSTSLRKSKSNSPTYSPTNTWKARSPDQTSGQRSPGSCYKAKCKTLSGSLSDAANSVIRRTASLDTIYLKGQWPRDCFYMYTSYLQVDKATQTDELLVTGGSEARKTHRLVDNCSTSDDKLKMIRHRLQRTTQNIGGRERHTLQAPGAVPGDHTVTLPGTNSQTTNTPPTALLSPTIKASPVNIPMKPLARPPIRSSIEGLNQEIEGLVLKATGVPADALFADRNSSETEKFRQVTPEGHRAPLADLLRSTRSVNTQTPAATDLLGSSQSSGHSSRESHSPTCILGLVDESRTSSDQGGSQGSSPDQEYGKLGTSPHINRFLAREPPDGCEKVNLKFVEDTMRTRAVLDLCPLKPSVTFQLKPSQGSAFYPLQQQQQHQPPLMASTAEETVEDETGGAAAVLTPHVPPAAVCPSSADRP